tara:strand:- start:47 stop:493 length:447 start_codon:yes stop_codon:yes gene_type:complete
MALTKVGKEGITGISNSSDATFLTVDSSEQAVIKGEGTATTNLQQGLIKAWSNFTMVSSTAYRDSFNSGTLTDNGTGSATVNLTNPFSNDDWAGSMYTNAFGTETTYSNHFAGAFDNRTSSSVRVAAHNGSVSIDAALNDVLFAGDLA